MIPRHVATVMVVVFRELHQQMIEVSFPEDDELVQAFQPDRFDEPLCDGFHAEEVAMRIQPFLSRN
jgi:hypothetical protein